MKYMNFANGIQSNGTETLITLLDCSPSMEEEDMGCSRLEAAILANLELCKAKAKMHPEDRVGIIGFGDEARVLHGPVRVGHGLESLQKALKRRWLSSGTNFTKALALAGRCFSNLQPKPRKGVIVKVFSQSLREGIPDEFQNCNRIIKLTDGQHNHSSCPFRVATHLKEAGVVIDCIGIGGSPGDVDEDLLKKIASKNADGSPRYCFIGDKDQLIQTYQTLSNHISVA